MRANALPSSPRSLVRLLLLGGLLLIFAALVWKGIRVTRLLASLQAREAAVSALLDEGPRNVSPADLEAQVGGLRTDVVALRREVGFLLPLTPFLGWIPVAGPLLAAAEPLLDMADHGSAAGVYLFRSLAPALDVVVADDGGTLTSRLPEVMTVVENAAPDVVQARLAMDGLVAARAAITDAEALPWRVRQLLARLDNLLPLAQDGLDLLGVLPTLAGNERPMTYLLVVQNEDELRPTGGFISGAGLLTVSQGRIAGIEFQDANLVDRLLQNSAAYDYPPDPLRRFMGLDYFLFRDANYWADFPTSAEQMLALYELGQGTAPDGVIAVNQRFVQMLLEVTGPVAVPALDLTLTSNDIVPLLREAWTIDDNQAVTDWILNRKAFIGLFAAALLTHVESDPLALDPAALLTMLETAVDGRHLQIYVRDPAAAAALRSAGWDGHVAAPAGSDVLFLVETNVGYSKVNPRVGRALTYELALNAAGGGRATAAIDYDHLSGASAAPCVQAKVYTEELTYDQLLDDCYWNYFRLLVPSGSVLIDASTHPAPAEAFAGAQAWSGGAGSSGEPGGVTVFDNFLLLSRGTRADAFFSYDLPAATARQDTDGAWTYRLQLHKQGGLLRLPVTINIALPPGADLQDSNVGLTELSLVETTDGVTLSGMLLGDGEIIIRYNLPPASAASGS